MTLCRGTLCLLCASEQEFDEVAAITALINQGSSGVEDGEEAADEAPIESSSIDSIVRGRLMLLDAVNEVLSKRVMDNYSDFVNGMSKVSELEEDLEMTSSVAQSCRHHLSLASAQVSLGLQIAQQTKTKRTIINMIQMLVNIKNASILKHELEQLLESGEYYDAIVSCMDCHEALGELPESVACTAELVEGLDELLVEAENRLGAALEDVCRQFDEEAYIKVYSGYIALNDPATLADKVVSCFTQALLDTTQQVVRTFALQMDTSTSSNGDGGGGNDILAKSRLPYNELCWQLPSVLIKGCIMKVLEVLFSIMESHETMIAWHQAKLDCVPTSSAGDAEEGTGGADGSEQMAAAFHAAVLESLHGCRRNIWDMAQQRVIKLISTPSVTEKGADFVTDDAAKESVLNWLFQFAHIGECFSKTEARLLRSAMTRQTSTYFSNMHKMKLEQLRLSLRMETWEKLEVAGCTNGCEGDEATSSDGERSSVTRPPSLVSILERRRLPPRHMDAAAADGDVDDFFAFLFLFLFLFLFGFSADEADDCSVAGELASAGEP